MAATGTDPARSVASTFACGQCGASLAFDGVRSQKCPYCASPNFVERPAPARPDPAFVIAFLGDAVVARRALERWLGSRTIFADAAIRSGTIQELRGIYVPAYVYSAVATTEYTAQIGENYTETEERTTRDSEGRTKTETRKVTRTEYRSLAGEHVGYVGDVVVSASAGLSHAELGRIEPFDFKQLRRFAPTLISGWITEEFSRSADECRQASRAEAADHVGGKLRRFMPGDSFSDLAWKTTVSWESMDPILVPVWVLAVRYRGDKPPMRIVINGQTGKVTGKVPLVAWKIAIAVMLGAGVLAALAYLYFTAGRS